MTSGLVPTIEKTLIRLIALTKPHAQSESAERGRGITLTYRLEPLEEGVWPTNIRAAGRFWDTEDRIGTYEFPVPTVRVRVPTATSTPTASASSTPSPSPTATATATPTATPSATPTPVPQPLYLPLLRRRSG
mgnify:CR=1 FL=1